MRAYLFVVFWGGLFLLGGCARPVPETGPLSPVEEKQVRFLVDGLVRSGCGKGVDADIRLAWEGYGESMQVHGSLLGQRPGRIRLAATDPLGRPQMLLVMDGQDFVFLDIPGSRGYTGPLDSSFVHRYLPSGLDPAELTGWLTGTLDTRIQILSVGREMHRPLYWVEGIDGQGRREQLCLDDQGRLIRRLLMDRQGRVAVEGVYSGYRDWNGCQRPGSLELSGSGVQGKVILKFLRYYPPAETGSAELFHPPVPAHFQLQRVE